MNRLLISRWSLVAVLSLLCATAAAAEKAAQSTKPAKTSEGVGPMAVTPYIPPGAYPTPPEPPTAAKTEQRVWTIAPKNISAQQLAKVMMYVLRRNYGDDPRNVSTDAETLPIKAMIFYADNTLKIYVAARGDSIVLSGNPGFFRMIEGIVLHLDLPRLAGADKSLSPSELHIAARDKDPKTEGSLLIFRLQYAAASTGFETLQRVLPSVPKESLWMEANDRNNSIIAFGSPETVQRITSVLRELDVPSADKDAASAPSTGTPSTAGKPQDEIKILKLTYAYSLTRAKATDVARILEGLFIPNRGEASPRFWADKKTNQLFVAGTPDQHAEIDALIRELDVRRLADSGTLARLLREKVAAAFEARQQLQRAEVAQLRERLARIEASIENRQRIREAIIDHRVKELLNPDLQWTPESNTASAGRGSPDPAHAMTEGLPKGKSSSMATSPSSAETSGPSNWRGQETRAERGPPIDPRIHRYAETYLRQYDKNKNGQLERDEWMQMRTSWQDADTSGDGIISLEELAAKMAGYTRPRPSVKPSDSPSGAQKTVTEHKAPTETTVLGASAEEKRIRAALKTPTEIEMTDMPLANVVDYLQARHKIPIQFDLKALAEIGLSTDKPITIHLKGVSLRSALRLLLHAEGLTYLVRDDVLLITSPDQAAKKMTTLTYPVGDLVLPTGTIETPSAGKRTLGDVESLIQLITTTVQPTTWNEVGGPGSITGVENKLSLVVTQTEEVHEEIVNLLESLRSVKAGSGGSPPLPPGNVRGGGTF